ncbi:MAG: hypothetical protein ACOZAM_23115 [Pseudomonadota bacterium]
MPVLVYRKNAASRGTVHRHYLRWRKERSLAVRCDNETCRYHHEALVWNGQSFKPILDHKNGVNTDNRPENLRYLCPLCDAQLTETRGGANKGRVEKSEGGFAISDKKSGLRGYVLPAEAATYSLGAGAPVSIEKIIIDERESK